MLDDADDGAASDRRRSYVDHMFSVLMIKMIVLQSDVDASTTVSMMKIINDYVGRVF